MASGGVQTQRDCPQRSQRVLAHLHWGAEEVLCWGRTARTPGGGAPARVAQASEGTPVASLAVQTPLLA